ncbi:uncharacterized protein [Aristolochia californica]|uniref:uncharacterized protein n=1 Tax=Aristolochia californica TaxID=171875 RepID=UPI0035E240BB
MVLRNLFQLSRLRRAIRKVRFLLSFNIHRWRVGSMVGTYSRRQLSFGDPQGLLDCADDDVQVEDLRTGSPPLALQRTISDDIDKKAEAFIENFYKRIQMERQVSLELRYLRGNGLERTLSD